MTEPWLNIEAVSAVINTEIEPLFNRASLHKNVGVCKLCSPASASMDLELALNAEQGLGTKCRFITRINKDLGKSPTF